MYIHVCICIYIRQGRRAGRAGMDLAVSRSVVYVYIYLHMLKCFCANNSPTATSVRKAALSPPFHPRLMGGKQPPQPATARPPSPGPSARPPRPPSGLTQPAIRLPPRPLLAESCNCVQSARLASVTESQNMSLQAMWVPVIKKGYIYIYTYIDLNVKI